MFCVRGEKKVSQRRSQTRQRKARRVDSSIVSLCFAKQIETREKRNLGAGEEIQSTQKAPEMDTTTAEQANNSNENKASADDTGDTNFPKVDPITALQDAIDGLSLAMFESLRSLRDAVAPESGNLGTNPNNNNNNNNEPDIEDLWHSYKHGDAKIRELMHQGDANHPVIQKREDFIRLHAKMEMQKDKDLVFRLAQDILNKSQDIDDQVDDLPGMEWTRQQQVARIQELLSANQAAKQELQEVYDVTLAKRDACRQAIKENTSKALGIEEE